MGIALSAPICIIVEVTAATMEGLETTLMSALDLQGRWAVVVLDTSGGDRGESIARTFSLFEERIEHQHVAVRHLERSVEAWGDWARHRHDASVVRLKAGEVIDRAVLRRGNRWPGQVVPEAAP